jgi:hypothetical protein
VKSSFVESAKVGTPTSLWVVVLRDADDDRTEADVLVEALFTGGFEVAAAAIAGWYTIARDSASAKKRPDSARVDIP